MRDVCAPDRSRRRRAALRAATLGLALSAGVGFTVAAGCSTSGRDLPAPTTTKPVTPRVITTVTAR